MKKIVIVVFSLLLFNSFIYFFVIPYMQKSINSHLAFAHNYAILMLVFIGICFLFSLYQFIVHKQSKSKYYLFFGTLNLVLWLPKILSLHCQGCINGG